MSVLDDWIGPKAQEMAVDKISNLPYLKDLKPIPKSPHSGEVKQKKEMDPYLKMKIQIGLLYGVPILAVGYYLYRRFAK